MLTETLNKSPLADSPLIPILAVVGIVLIGLTWFLWRRKDGRRPKLAVATGTLALAVHVILFMLVPEKLQQGSGDGEASGRVNGDAPVMVALSDVASFEPNQPASDDPDQAAFAPPMEMPSESQEIEPAVVTAPVTDAREILKQAAEPELSSAPPAEEFASDAIDQMLTDLLLADATVASPDPNEVATSVDTPVASQQPSQTQFPVRPSLPAASATTARTVSTRVADPRPDDFANRKGLAKRSALIATGGDESTEAAVAAGLRFLVSLQQPDGTWDPLASGAGQERATLGHNRGGAGRRAVTGITGLAVLSLLGNGHTHLEGPFADNVARGLQALMNRQAADGSLGGPAGTYARMYCHGIAALALSEAYAMSKDNRLVTATANALNYSARIQHPHTGGWRYQPGDTGDLSQFGWQAMAMQSGKLSGMSFDRRIDDRLEHFLTTVRSGRGGLAAYRPGRPASRTMTAEALATRLLLGHEVPQNEIDEAESYLLQETPGMSEDNFYYWYYASLALHQIQSPAWQAWNQRMKSRLVQTQRPDGSWPANTVWGGYGGEVYTTAMGCLCLEVYYRHLTLHQTAEKIAQQPGRVIR